VVLGRKTRGVVEAGSLIVATGMAVICRRGGRWRPLELLRRLELLGRLEGSGAVCVGAMPLVWIAVIRAGGARFTWQRRGPRCRVFLGLDRGERGDGLSTLGPYLLLLARLLEPLAATLLHAALKIA
jgi:hypothetical protein